MCGRTFRISNGRRIREQFGIIDPGDVPDDFPPSWNIAPTTIQPIVRLSRDTHEREPMRWGLVPYWAKDMNVLAGRVMAYQMSNNEELMRNCSAIGFTTLEVGSDYGGYYHISVP